MTVPTFLVAGAARSGTTALVEGLRTHPRVFVTQPKEPHYFALHGRPADFQGPGDDATVNRVSVTDRAEYLSLYPERHDFLALGDGAVSTLYYAEHAVPEILAVNPDMRVVLMLRDPVERAFSSFQYLRARGFEPHEDFMAALADEPRRVAANWHHLWHYTGMSRYADGLRRLRVGLGAQRVGVWFYDDLEADYERTVRAVLRFLQVPTHPAEARGVPRVNVSGTPRLAAVQKVLWAATRNEPVRRTVKRFTSYRFRERIRRNSLQRSGVPAPAREHLEPLFAADLADVAGQLPGPLPQWLRGTVEGS